MDGENEHVHNILSCCKRIDAAAVTFYSNQRERPAQKKPAAL